MRRASVICLCILALALGSVATGCQPSQKPVEKPAQEAPKETPKIQYPTRPITVVVPFAAGGGVDVTARVWAKYASKVLGQPVNIENKTGGGGVVGHTAGATATPDGYTLTMITTPLTWQYLTSDGVNVTPDSFEPIAQVTVDPNVIIVKTGSPLDMPVKDFIDYLKANPNKVKMGVGGRWATHDLARGLLQVSTGVEISPVFFDGGSQVITNLLGGHVDAGFPFFTEFASHYKAGTIKVIASASDAKHPFLPEVPTLKENGIDVVAGTWRAIAAPKGTPSEILAILDDVTNKIMADPEAKAEFEKAVIAPIYLGAADFKKVYDADAQRYKTVVEQLKK